MHGVMACGLRLTRLCMPDVDALHRERKERHFELRQKDGMMFAECQVLHLYLCVTIYSYRIDL